MIDLLILRDFREDNRFSMEVYADSLAAALRDSGGVDLRVRELTPRVPKFLNNIQGMRLARYILYPLQVLGRKASIYHIMDHGYGHLTAFINPSRTVVTVHDLIPVVCWKGGIPGAAPDHVPLLAYHSFKSLKKARFLIADSNNTKQDLIKYLDCIPEKIFVIPPGVDPIFKPLDQDQKLRFRRKWLGGEDNQKYILMSGLGFYKNHEMVFKTVAHLRSLGWDQIRIVKTKYTSTELERLEKQYGLENLVVNLGEVSREELPGLYSAVDLLFFPSLYEGFGWPPLEAMACGTPVVSSNGGSLPEVIGDAAAMFDPYDVNGFAGEIARIFSDERYCQERIEKGLIQSGKFLWQESANQIMTVYNQIMQGISG